MNIRVAQPPPAGRNGHAGYIMTAETPGFFHASDGTPLYGVWHTATGTPRDSVVLTPALLDERRTASAAWVSLARHLAAHGFPVLRFEFRGEGESLGDGSRRLWTDLNQDLLAAGQFASRSAPSKKVHLVALRLGASAAWQTVHTQSAPDSFSWASLLAIAPVVKGAAQERLWRLRTKIRKEMGGQQNFGLASSNAEELDFDGLPIHAQFMEAVKTFDLTKIKPAGSRTHVIQISFKEDLSAETQALVQAGTPNVTAQGLKLEPFWDRLEVIDTKALNEAVLSRLS